MTGIEEFVFRWTAVFGSLAAVFLIFGMLGLAVAQVSRERWVARLVLYPMWGFLGCAGLMIAGMTIAIMAMTFQTVGLATGLWS